MSPFSDDRYDGPPPMGPPPPASADWYRQPPMRPGGHGDGGPGPGPYGPPMPPQQRGGPPPPSGGWGGGPSGPHRGGPPMGYGPGPQQPPMDRRPGGPPMPPPPQQQQHQRFGNYQPVQMGGNRMVVDVDKEDADEEHRQMQQTMEREAAIERSRQKRRLAQQGSIPSEGEYGPIGSGPPMRPVDPFDQPPNENDRPSSRDSYGRSHGAKRELPPRLQQKQKDRAAAAAGGNFDEAGNKVGGDRRWDARAGGDYADVNGGNGMTGGKSRRRVKQPRKDADDRLGPEVRLLKRPDSKDSASSAEADLGRSSSDRSMTVESSRRVATTYEDDDEELNLTKLSRPAARVIKRVAPNPQQSSADKDGGKTQQQSQQKPQREKQRPAAPQSQSAASADAKGDAKQSEDAAAAAALATEFKEAPPPAENIWEKRMEERESAEREKQVVIGGSLDGADDDFQDLQMPQQHQRRQQFQPQQQQHNVNPRDPHAQTLHRTRGSGLRQRRPSGGRQDQGAGHPASAKSPVASEGYDEWETASESSDIGSRRHSKDPLANQEVNGNGNRKSTQPRFSQQRRERPPRGGPLRAPKDGAKSPSNPADADKGANSKNAKPASHLQGNQPNASTKRRGEVLEDSNDTSACKNTDGLAGFDINNAGVIVIDDQPDVDGHSERGFDDFEEVLSKKEKRARQQRLQELQEKEEKRRLRERERQEKLQQKKRSHEKQHAEKRAAAAAASESAAPATITVWNSATAGGNGASERKLSGTPDAKKGSMLEQATVTTMPSPIARPTPKNKQTAQSATTAVVLPSPADMSASSGTMPAGNSKTGVEIWGSPDVASYGADGQPASHLVDELGRPTPAKSVEFPASFGSPPELDPSDKFDFTFDPNLPTNDSSTRQSPVLGPVGDIPAPTAMNGAKLTSSSSLGDQQQLQEKLDKVKDIWPGGDEAAIVSSAASLLVSQQLGSSSVAVETSPAAASKSSLAEGPHVAKVRPQPQTNEGGPSSASANAFHVHQQQASKPTPPTSAIGPYSMCLPSMAPPVASFQLTTSSPPNFSLQPQQPQAQMGGPMQRSPFDHPQMFAHPPPSAMPWSTGGGQMDMLAGIGAPSQPPQNIGGQQQQRQQPPPPGIGFQQSSASQQQPATYGLPPPPPGSSLKTAMAGGFGPLMSAPPPDFVNVAQPPPMLGAVGSQRSQARPQLPTQLQLGAIGSQAFTGYLPPSAPTNQHQHQHQHQHQPPNSFVAPPPLGQPRFTGPPPTLGALDLSQTMGPPPPMFAKPQGPNAGWNGPPPPNKTAVNPNAANFGPFGSMKFGGFAQQMTANPSANQRQGPAPIQPMPSSTTNQRGSGPAPIQRPTNHGQPLPTRRPPSAHLHHDGGKEGSDLLLQQSIDRFISDGGDEQQAKKIGH
uniref:BAT2 N-terminal domain-containing protein n=2 Tax=Plectus sambesii TaxID=2011161 RepID=A0A914VRR6_9BILA